LALDYQRRANVRNRYHVDVDLDAVAEVVAGDAQDPEQILIGRERLARLQQALSELPLDCRTAFTLHSVQGLTYAEIAQRLGVSRSQVNKLLSKAIAHCAMQVDGPT
jgi:RNA polymerase sigma-70 factor (ECF subfamily)